MSERIAAGAWVEIAQVALAPGERAPQAPEDTRALPLEVRVCGRLVAAGHPGEDVEIETRAGRRLRGRLSDPAPRYRHGFGAPVRELLEAGDEARALLLARGGDPP